MPLSTGGFQSPLDLNQADSLDLESLPGIGPVLARRILRYRKAKGCFKYPEELLQVYGISEAWYAAHKAHLKAGPCQRQRIKKRYVKKSGYSETKASVMLRPDYKINLNETDSLELVKYHILPPWLVRMVLRERAYNGCFTGWNQLERIGPLTLQQLDTLKQYAELGQCRQRMSPRRLPKQEKERILINLNLSDSAAFKQIPGISSGLIRKIIGFRSRMRFFITLDQVLEMKYPPALDEWAEILPYLAPVRLEELPDSLFLHINSADEAVLGRHPYIGYSLASRIINYRNQHGKFVSLKSMGKIYGVKPGTWEKLSPYLRFE
jgi:DNA uptake protein ComE-like DNA-binding protein